MVRKRTNHGESAARVIAIGAARGHTATAIAQRLRGMGITMSARTVGRRLSELRGRVRLPRLGAKRAPAGSSSPDRGLELANLAEDVPIPEGLGVRELAVLMIKADRVATRAFEAGDLVAFAAMARLVARVADEIRKASPSPTISTREDWPDMAAAAARARARLAGLVGEALGDGSAATR